MQVVALAATSLAGTILVVGALSAAAVGLGMSLFGMTVGGAMALYFIVWWTALFAILPLGVRSQAEVGDIADGSDPGAPARPALNEKAIWTSLAATIVFMAVAWLLPLAGL
jgi:predicted secreted protein